MREEVGLLRLGSADLIQQKVSFPNSGPDATPGVIVMLIDDLLGADVDPELEGALVVFNASPEATTQTIGGPRRARFRAHDAQANGSDAIVKTTTWDAATGTVTVPARSVAVLVDTRTSMPRSSGGGRTLSRLSIARPGFDELSIPAGAVRRAE